MKVERKSYREVDCSAFFPDDPVSTLLHQDWLVHKVILEEGIDFLYPEAPDVALIESRTGLTLEQIYDTLGVMTVSKAAITRFIDRCS